MRQRLASARPTRRGFNSATALVAVDAADVLSLSLATCLHMICERGRYTPSRNRRFAINTHRNTIRTVHFGNASGLSRVNRSELLNCQ